VSEERRSQRWSFVDSPCVLRSALTPGSCSAERGDVCTADVTMVRGEELGGRRLSTVGSRHTAATVMGG